MDQEIEVKFLLSDYEKLMRKVRALNLVCTRERAHELNLRFDQPDRRLSSQRQVLRLRKDKQAILTFKGPGVLEGDVLMRKEIETVVSDFEAVSRILAALGYEIIMMYEKFRANYLMAAATLSIDETPLGLFVELEGDSPQAVREAAELLELDWEQRINLSYEALLNICNHNRGCAFRDLSFANFEPLQVKPADLNLKYADE